VHLEHLEFPEYLGPLVILEFPDDPEILARPVPLENLEFLEFLGTLLIPVFLDDLGNLELLDCLGILEDLAIPENQCPANLENLDFLVGLELLANLQILEILEIQFLVSLECPETPEILESLDFPLIPGGPETLADPEVLHCPEVPDLVDPCLLEHLGLPELPFDPVHLEPQSSPEVRVDQLFLLRDRHLNELCYRIHLQRQIPLNLLRGGRILRARLANHQHWEEV
jgi:hypothetical protein